MPGLISESSLIRANLYVGRRPCSRQGLSRPPAGTPAVPGTAVEAEVTVASGGGQMCQELSDTHRD